MKHLTLSSLSVALALLVSACSSTSENLTTSALWQPVTFGQSTDANFATNVMPNKIGVNFTYLPSGEIAKPELALPLSFPLTIESRGGKIGNSHDGLTFYYTKLEGDKNFVLEAVVRIEQFGPENGAKPAAQEGCGLLVRDIIGPNRNEPVKAGIEEFPASSNMVMTAVLPNDKRTHNNVSIMQVNRNGVKYPWGNQNIDMERKAIVDDIDLSNNNTFILRLERTNEGFISSYAPYGSQDFLTLQTHYPNRINKLDSDCYYLGFFASRNARMSVLDASLYTSKAHLKAMDYVAPSELPYLELSSAPLFNEHDATFNLSARTNQSGLLEVSLGNLFDSLRAQSMTVRAGEFITLPIELKNKEQYLSYRFTSDNKQVINGHIDLSANKLLGSPMLYASPLGKASGQGTKNSPLDVATALKLIKDGGQVVLLEGDYDLTTLGSECSGSTNALKSLIGNSKTVFKGLNVAASYLKLTGFTVTTKPLNISGSYNHIKNITAHHCDDTGIWVASPKEVGRALWASHNLIEDCTSYQNQDPGNINADGFAVKMRVGEGNRIVRALSWGNADDGYDLFNKIEDGPNGSIVIEDSVAMFNNNNGFKLGGEGLPVAHSITHSIAYCNGMDGFTDNFNPGAIEVKDNISIDNKRFNFLFRKGPYVKDVTEQGNFENNLSLRSSDGSYADVINGNLASNNSFLTSSKKNTKGYTIYKHTKGQTPKRNKDGTLPQFFFIKK